MKDFICVMKSNSEQRSYNAKHVRLLYKQLLFTQKYPFRLHCLTDTPINHPDINEIPLEHGLVGWWSKLEIFKHFKRGVYLDLDLIITADISELFSVKKLTMLEDEHPIMPANSSVIALCGQDYSHLLDDFLSDVQGYMLEYKVTPKLGDQVFISDRCDYDIIPTGEFHAHFRANQQSKIINCHGPKKAWDLNQIWAELLDEA